MVVTGVIMTFMVVIMGVDFTRSFFSFHARFVEHFLEFAFAAFYVDCDAIVFSGIWSDTVTQVGSTRRCDHDIWLHQSKMGSTAALVGGSSAVARKTHSWEDKGKIGMARA